MDDTSRGDGHTPSLGASGSGRPLIHVGQGLRCRQPPALVEVDPAWLHDHGSAEAPAITAFDDLMATTEPGGTALTLPFATDLATEWVYFVSAVLINVRLAAPTLVVASTMVATRGWSILHTGAHLALPPLEAAPWPGPP